MKHTLHNLPIFSHLHFADLLPQENLYPIDLTGHNLCLFRKAEYTLNTRMFCTFLLTLVGLLIAAYVPSFHAAGWVGIAGIVVYTRFLLQLGRLVLVETAYRNWSKTFTL